MKYPGPPPMGADRKSSVQDGFSASDFLECMLASLSPPRYDEDRNEAERQ
eukprot:COSAG05_NODE_22924_length_261_cov_0.938272_1_plen_49_part_10